MPASPRTIRHIVMRRNQKFRRFRVLQNEGIREVCPSSQIRGAIAGYFNRKF
jgi:hypothetical protein